MATWFEFDYAYLLPLFLGFYRWGMYLVLKVIPALFYKPYPLNYNGEKIGCVGKAESIVKITKKDCTMIIPVYMPEPGFDDCVLSWIASQPKKIVIVSAVVGYQGVVDMVAEMDHKGVEVIVISDPRPGKRAAMYRGLDEVDTELTIFADDDALYYPKLLDSIIQPFKDPMMGGVGTRQIARPKNEDGTWDMWDIIMDMRLFQRYIEIRATSFMGGGASCLSGRTMGYRTKLFKPTQEYYENTFKKAFLSEHFLGQLQLSGDDKCLTRMCINSEYKMYTQICYDCTLSTQFEKGSKLLGQILRWSRNTWRSDLKLLFVEWTVWWKYPWLMFVLLDKIISPFTMVAGPIIVIVAMIMKRNAFIFVGFLAYLVITRTIKGIMYFAYGNPRPPMRWIFYMPHFIIFQYFSAVFRIWALFTLSNRKWGNRNVKVSNKTGKIVYTDENGKRFKDDGDTGDDADPEIEEDLEMGIQVIEVNADEVEHVVLTIVDDDDEKSEKSKSSNDHGSSSIERANDEPWGKSGPSTI